MLTHLLLLGAMLWRHRSWLLPARPGWASQWEACLVASREEQRRQEMKGEGRGRHLGLPER